MVAFIAANLIVFGLVSLVFPMAKRRPVGTPLTWGEAMVASTYAFFLMFWAYGIIPHLWLSWTSDQLNWRPDTFMYEYWDVPIINSLFKPQEEGGPFPVSVTMQTLRDLVVVVIYVVFLAGQMWLWSYWQKRGEKKTTEVATSEFGRPLVKAGAGAGS